MEIEHAGLVLGLSSLRPSRDVQDTAEMLRLKRGCLQRAAQLYRQRLARRDTHPAHYCEPPQLAGASHAGYEAEDGGNSPFVNLGGRRIGLVEACTRPAQGPPNCSTAAEAAGGPAGPLRLHSLLNRALFGARQPAPRSSKDRQQPCAMPKSEEEKGIQHMRRDSSASENLQAQEHAISGWPQPPAKHAQRSSPEGLHRFASEVPESRTSDLSSDADLGRADRAAGPERHPDPGDLVAAGFFRASGLDLGVGLAPAAPCPPGGGAASKVGRGGSGSGTCPEASCSRDTDPKFCAGRGSDVHANGDGCGQGTGRSVGSRSADGHVGRGSACRRIDGGSSTGSAVDPVQAAARAPHVDECRLKPVTHELSPGSDAARMVAATPLQLRGRLGSSACPSPQSAVEVDVVPATPCPSTDPRSQVPNVDLCALDALAAAAKNVASPALRERTSGVSMLPQFQLAGRAPAWSSEEPRPSSTTDHTVMVGEEALPGQVPPGNHGLHAVPQQCGPQLPAPGHQAPVLGRCLSSWELHMPGEAEAVFACSGTSTIACLVSRPAASSPVGGKLACPSPTSCWDLLIMTAGFEAQGGGPAPLGSLSLRPQPAAKHLGAQLSLPCTLQLLDVPSVSGREACEGTGSGAAGSGRSTVLLVACGAWGVDNPALEGAGGQDLCRLRSGADGLDNSRQPRPRPRGNGGDGVGGGGSGGSSSVWRQQHGVDVLAMCHASGAWSWTQHLDAAVPTLCVLAVEALGLVVAAGRHGQAHVWRLGGRDGAGGSTEHSPGCCPKTGDWLSAGPDTESWGLPPASYKGLPVNEVVELRVAPEPSGRSVGGLGRCRVLGCSSDGTVAVWDVLSRQLLSAIHVPMCDISCMQPMRGLLHGPGGAGSQHEAAAWPVLMLAKVSEQGVELLAGQHGLPGHGSQRGGGVLCKVAPLALWPDGADLCPGPDLEGTEHADVQQGRLPACRGLTGESSSVSCLAVQGGLAAVGTCGGQVLVWDAAAGGRPLSRLDCSAGGRAVASVALAQGSRGGQGQNGSGSGIPGDAACGSEQTLLLVAGAGHVLMASVLARSSQEAC